MFILYKGSCARTLKTNTIVNDKALFPQSIREETQVVILDYLPIGTVFGIKACMTKSRQLNSVEVVSKKATVFKIHQDVFRQNFGGWTGEPMQILSSETIMRRNWLNMKVGHIQHMTLQALKSLDYRSDAFYRSLKPTVTIVKENTYL